MVKDGDKKNIYSNERKEIVDYVIDKNSFDNLYLNKLSNKELEYRLKDMFNGNFPNPGGSGLDKYSSAPPTGSDDPRHILTPLDDVILQTQLKDDIVERCGVPELIDRSGETAYSGAILFGPPGTGKSVMLDAVRQCYERAGAYAAQVSSSQIISKWVGESAKNMRQILDEAVAEAEKRGLPSFIYVDEGEVIVQNAEEGSASVAKAYQAVINVLKEYIGNHRNLVVGITTNILPDSLEAAMTREGRLTTFFVDYPKDEQVGELWQHFATRHAGLELTVEQGMELAGLSGNASGAFIEEFTRNYRNIQKRKILRKRGYSSLIEAMKDSYRPKGEEVDARVNFDNLLEDVKAAIPKHKARNGNGKKKKKPIGFASQVDEEDEKC